MASELEERVAPGGLRYVVRPGTSDAEIVEEIFTRRLYELPPRVAALLGAAPKVVDLGANIGLFGVYLASLRPDARITAFEPDPDNVRVLRRCIELNGVGWQVVAACAGAADGLVPFVAGLHDQSRIAAGALEQGATVVPILDVFPYLEGAALLKVDIQGGEWEILADARLATCGVPALCLEYHAYMCPDPEAPLETAQRLLADAGFVHDLIVEGDGDGMLWAWRPGARRSDA